jgi:protein involved in polysaccharide export with SLBB domain
LSHPSDRSSATVPVTACLALLFCGAFAPSPDIQNDILVRPGDHVSVYVFNHPELSETLVVDPGSHIALPLIGSIDTANATPRGLARTIKLHLKPYLPKAAVEVTITDTQATLQILGGPVGILPYHPEEHLAEALTEIGAAVRQLPASPSDDISDQHLRNLQYSRIDLTHVGVIRDGKSLGVFDSVAMREAGESGVLLYPNDEIVFVDKPIKVHVKGEVQEPGPAYLMPDETLSDAILQTGNLLPTASSMITLSRNGETQVLALGNAQFSAPAQAGDVLIVRRAPRVGVVGAVEKPGDVVLHGDTSLISAIYNAGGPSRNANLKKVSIVHGGTRTEHDVLALVHGTDHSIQDLDDGDTVFVPVGHKVDFTAFWQAVGAAGTIIYAVK